MRKTVAIIGAGPCGLAGIKACIEEDIDAVCFEKTEEIGGLWRYHDDDEYGRPSVMKSTVINSHKEMSAYTDFPPPAEFPSYMHHSQLLKYIEMYAEHFKLRPYVRFHHEVVSVSRSGDYDETGRWIVVTKSLESGIVNEETYDGVMVCTGHHAYKHMPELPGQSLFQGNILHSQSVKTNDAFKDLNVLVVGVGNSGMDVAVEISDVAKQVYLSTRRGAWVVGRRGPHGFPFDPSFNNRMLFKIMDIIGWELASRIFEYFVVDVQLNHDLYGLKPKHRFLSQHPTTNDFAPTKILSGRIIIKRNIKTLTETGVIFEDDTSTPIDAIVLATGYSITFPFIKESFADIKDNKIEFYKQMFPPHLKHPSLAFMGLVQPNGAVFPIVDCQTRWFTLLINNKKKLPPPEKMIEETYRARKAARERFIDSPRHTIQVDFLPYLDSIASEAGIRPNMLKLMFTDPKLFFICFFGPCLPYQYRLQGSHPWPGAKDAILKFPYRVSKPLSSGLTKYKYSHFESSRVTLPILFTLFSIILNVCLILRYFF